jgi:hypothetical protein
MSVVNLLVEGVVDEAVGRRLVEVHGGTVGASFGKRGAGYIQAKISDFSRSSVGMPIFAIVDLMDTRFDCAPELVGNWLPHPAPSMVFRAAVREIESWIIADSENLASHLSVHYKRIPAHPDEVRDPKAELIRVARRSRSSAVKQGMVPRKGASIGPRYNSLLVGFVGRTWDPDAAARRSPSLARARTALEGLISRL